MMAVLQIQLFMKSLPKILKLVGKPPTICQTVTFPLSESTLKEIQQLKLVFRQSFIQYDVFSLGMAFPQIGINKRIFIMPTSFNYRRIHDMRRLKRLVKDFNIYINPSILWKSEEQKIDFEYCFSVEQNEFQVKRSMFVEVKYFNELGQEKIQKLPQLRSRVFQHQNDHLDGILVSDIGQRVNPSKQQNRKNN